MITAAGDESLRVENEVESVIQVCTRRKKRKKKEKKRQNNYDLSSYSVHGASVIRYKSMKREMMEVNNDFTIVN